jgi:hypothetical protein
MTKSEKFFITPKKTIDVDMMHQEKNEKNVAYNSMVEFLLLFTLKR